MTNPQRLVYDDLREFSRTASVDEELLLTLYRQSAWEDRTETLARLSRLHFTPFFAAHFNREKDAQDNSYLHEELEQALRYLCPREHLGNLQIDLCEPYFSIIWRSAWGGIAPVILGAREQDGQRADELFRAVQAHCAAERLHHARFKRMDALALIEDWREAALRAIFSVSQAPGPANLE